MSEGRGRCQSFGDEAPNDCRGASPVADTTDPPQAEGEMRAKPTNYDASRMALIRKVGLTASNRERPSW